QKAVIHVATVNAGAEICRLGEPKDGWDPINTHPVLTFSSDGQHLAAWESATNDVLIWNVKTAEFYRRIPGKEPTHVFGRPVCLAYSTDGRTLAVGGMAGE